MPCYRPIKGYRSATANENGKRPLVFKPTAGYSDFPIDVPCGQCIGCRLERSRQWAIRCVHEASLYPDNCFITLTYAPEFLPPDGSLVKKHFQDFMKRLRFRFEHSIRYFHCGEYGEQCLNCSKSKMNCRCGNWVSSAGRPHYHAILFNHDFCDKEIQRTTKDGHHVYTSKVLQELWPFGLHEIGTATFESAAYVARYITKKITGPEAEAHYLGRIPEYVTMSRRPGIGRGWFDRFTTDIYPHDRVVIRGKEMRPPRFYDTQFELANREKFFTIKCKRKYFGALSSASEPESRLAVKEEVQELTAKLLKRGYENE